MNRFVINQKEGMDKKNNERGATMVEYAVMVALIAVVVIAAVRVLGSSVSQQMSSAASQVN
jgi:pilus assembly protein Flp/PilA